MGQRETVANDTTVPFNISMDLFKVRIETQCVPVRNLWFPSRDEMMDWQGSEKPMYVRWTGSHSLEIGLRQETMAAARMAPQWFMTIHANDAEHRVRIRQGFPKYTKRLLGLLAISVGVWGFFVPLHWTDLWRGTAGIIVLTTFIAWYVGNQKLKRERNQIEQLLCDAPS